LARLEITSDYDNIDWKEVILVLTAYAYSLINTNNIGINNEEEKKELASDFALGTIKDYLENKDKFDPKRNADLIKYLKYNILKRSVFNYKKSSKNLKESRLQENDKSNSDEENYDGSKKLEDIYINSDIDIDAIIDISSIVDLIEKEIEDDDELYEIFIGRYEMESKRSEICKDLKITTSEYNNRMRKIRRRVKKILNSFQEFKLQK